MSKNNQTTAIFPFLYKYKVEVLFTLGYLLVSNFLLGYLQKGLYCVKEGYCQHWVGSSGFVLMNLALGWIVCLYLILLVQKKRLSLLLKLLFPVVLILYLLGNYYFLGNYVLVTQDFYITRNSMFEPEKKYNLSEFDYVYKSGSSGDGWDYYSIKLKNGNSVSITNDSVIPYLYSLSGLFSK